MIDVQTWKLLAALGLAPIVMGAMIIALGVYYDSAGRVPGQLVLAGMAMASSPFLILSAFFRAQIKALEEQANATRRKALAEAEEAEERALHARAARVIQTGSFAALTTSAIRPIKGAE